MSSRARLVRLLTAACLAAPAMGAVAGCGGSASAADMPSVTGAVGEQASISIPAGLEPPAKVESTVLEQGGGKRLADGDAVVVDYTLMDWTGAKLIGSTYSTGGSPNKTQEFVLGSPAALASWNQVLPQVTVGSRVEIVTPPAGAFGTKGATAYGISGRDDLVYVLDVVGAYPGGADITGIQPAPSDPRLPRVTGNPGTGAVRIAVPHGVAAPGGLVSKVLIRGSGAPIVTGQRLMAQYAGADWNTGKMFESSFAKARIASFVFGGPTVIPGWTKGLAGTHVGDRVLLVVPAADAYGAKGVPSAGIGGGDTLVFVIDLVDALS